MLRRVRTADPDARCGAARGIQLRRGEGPGLCVAGFAGARRRPARHGQRDLAQPPASRDPAALRDSRLRHEPATPGEDAGRGPRRRPPGARRRGHTPAGEPHARRRRRRAAPRTADLCAEQAAGAGTGIPGPELPGQPCRPSRFRHSALGPMDARRRARCRPAPRDRGVSRVRVAPLSHRGHRWPRVRVRHGVLR